MNKQTKKKGTHTLCRFEEKQEEYILILFQVHVAEGEHSPQQRERGAAAISLHPLEQLRRHVSDLQGSYAGLQSLERDVQFQHFKRDDTLQEMWDEIHSASGQPNSCFRRNPGSSQTDSGHPDAHFNSPVNGLESSALLLQFNTVLIYIFIYI